MDLHEEEKLGSYSNLSQFNHINVEMNTSNNNGKQPATAAANSIQWDVEEGMYCISTLCNIILCASYISTLLKYLYVPNLTT